jgi:hypothetical protein
LAVAQPDFSLLPILRSATVNNNNLQIYEESYGSGASFAVRRLRAWAAHFGSAFN